MAKPVLRLTPDAEATLRGYDYPGNVRELRNIVERAVILAGVDAIDRDSIMLRSTHRAPPPPPSVFFSVEVPPGAAPPSLDDLERGYIARLLEFTGGNRTQVARILGVSYPTVAKKIADYGL